MGFRCLSGVWSLPSLRRRCSSSPRAVQTRMDLRSSVGRPPTEATIANAAKLAVDGAKPLPMTGYKLELLSGLVRDVLESLSR